MRYLALATDYDGTLATNGHASADAIASIARLRESGRRSLLLTGRRLEELLKVFPELNLFDYTVAENGAVVYSPGTKEVTLLGEPPPAEFLARLKSLGVNCKRCLRILEQKAPGHLLLPGRTTDSSSATTVEG